MIRSDNLRAILLASTCSIISVNAAFAGSFDIPGGDLQSALKAYSAQSGVPVVVSDATIKGARTKGIKGELPSDEALSRILRGTGFTTSRDPSGVIAIVPGGTSSDASDIQLQPMHFAQATPTRAAVETVTVTSSKLGGADVQSIPIAITALSQEQLTATQTAGGPDLVKQVPNLTFSKTNFSGYNLQIRGIGTQAISVATDPAVAVAFNDTPFIRNHFFEQEFFDVSQVEVLRGPQGTLYGRNATAGVVNVTSAKPTDQFEAMASADIGNFKNRRFEGMINIPFDSDRLDLRVAGEWTKRDGYTYNETTGQQVDGRDLWSGRVTLGWKPISTIQTYLVWEHFQEDDDRLRSGKQLCKTDPGLSSINGINVPAPHDSTFDLTSATFSQGCLPASLYSRDSFEVPNGFSLPFISGASFLGIIDESIDPYKSTTQSTNLRDIQSAIEPKYLAKNNTLEFNVSWSVAPSLTFYSDTGYNRDFLWSSEDYDRFDTSPGIFRYPSAGRPWLTPDPASTGGIFCDPQLGCSDRLVVQDLSAETASQFSQEFRLASNFIGPLNFSAGGNYMHYETLEKYYVFSNTFTMISISGCGNDPNYIPSETTHLYCLNNGRAYLPTNYGSSVLATRYIDPNPLESLDGNGHNYFVSQNPYNLNSYALFGETYYNITDDFKLTGGLRWTDDQKHFVEIPSQLLTSGYGYPSTGTVDQTWSEFTGRFVANWSPKLSFTDQSMFYGSYSHGYKAGGANPPGAVLLSYISAYAIPFPAHPQTFKPEFIDAYELGTKNTLLDGAMTLNGDVFFYNYKDYQISQIVDRSSINLNFNATVKGAELEATWEPVPGLKFSFAGGYEATKIDNGQAAIDLIDRTAGHSDWVVMKPWVGQSSNCIFPAYVAAAIVQQDRNYGEGNIGSEACGVAYYTGLDPVSLGTYSASWNGPADPSHNLIPGQAYYTVPNTFGTGSTSYGYPVTITNGYPATAYPGFDPLTAPNGGEGFAKPVGGNELPNAPHFTLSLSADYSLPVTPDWAATLHSDFYWQSDSWARVFNDNPYDRIHGYTNLNLALILSDTSGWQIMGYVKNVFDTTAITGDFLNSDDSGLTTNVFLTDPRLFGVRVTKHFDGGNSSTGAGLDFLDGDKSPQVWVQLGGNFNAALADSTKPYDPTGAPFFPNGGNATPSWPVGLPTPAELQQTPKTGFDWEGKLTFQPEDTDWVLMAGIRYGRSFHSKHSHKSQIAGTKTQFEVFGNYFSCAYLNVFAAYNPVYGQYISQCYHGKAKEFVDSTDKSSEQHMMLDFMLGKDVGIGTFNEKGTSVVSAGVRLAQFRSSSELQLGADPVYHLVANTPQKYHDVYEFASNETRSFHGLGPEVSWDASQELLGNDANGAISLDWGVNLGVLFGKRNASLHHTVNHCRVGWKEQCGGEAEGIGYDLPSIVEPADDVNRSSMVSVPNIGGYIGASMKYRNGKVSLGYRADTFFNAIDGGEETAKSYNRGFYGPYLNVSLGL